MLQKREEFRARATRKAGMGEKGGQGEGSREGKRWGQAST